MEHYSGHLSSMIRSIELRSQVAISTKLNASFAAQKRIELRAEVLCSCDSVSRVYSLDFEDQMLYAIHRTLDKIKVKPKFFKGSVHTG